MSRLFQDSSKAPVASPTFTGNPTIPGTDTPLTLSSTESFSGFHATPSSQSTAATNGGWGTDAVLGPDGALYWAVINTDTTGATASVVYKRLINGTTTIFASSTVAGASGTSLVFDTTGNLYWAVSAFYNGTTYNLTSYIYKITSAGVKTTFASVSTSGSLQTSLVVDTSNNLFWAVTNSYDGTTYVNNAKIYKITPGGTLSQFASEATTEGAGTDLVIDGSNNLYWAVMNQYDGTTYSKTSYIYKVTSSAVKTLHVSQATIGAGFTNLLLTASGDIYWAVMNSFDGTSYIQNSYVYKVTPTQVVSTYATFLTSGAYAASQVFDPSGNLLVAITNERDSGSYLTASFLYSVDSSNIVTIVATQGTSAGRGASLAYDTEGNLAWAINNCFNASEVLGVNTAYLNLYTPGTVSVTNASTSLRNTAQVTAEILSRYKYYTPINTVQGVATHSGMNTDITRDSLGNLYWAVTNFYNGTTHNLTSYVYKITPDGTFSTFASYASYAGVGTALLIDASDNLYWAVTNNYNEGATSYTVTSFLFKITPAGTRTTFASQTTYGGHGTDLVFGPDGNIYWAVNNYWNGTTYSLTSWVFKITPAGTKTTFASVATTGGAGVSLLFDVAQNLYWAIAQYRNGANFNLTSYIYKVTPAGTLTTFASQATNGVNRTSIVFDANGNLFWGIGNGYNNSTYFLTSYIYKISINGTKTTYSYVASVGASCTDLIFDADGNLFWSLGSNYDGATNNLYSVFYKIDADAVARPFATFLTYRAVSVSQVFDSFGNLFLGVSNYSSDASVNTTSYLYRFDKQTIS